VIPSTTLMAVMRWSHSVLLAFVVGVALGFIMGSRSCVGWCASNPTSSELSLSRTHSTSVSTSAEHTPEVTPLSLTAGKPHAVVLLRALQLPTLTIAVSLNVSLATEEPAAAAAPLFTDVPLHVAVRGIRIRSGSKAALSTVFDSITHSAVEQSVVDAFGYCNGWLQSTESDATPHTLLRRHVVMNVHSESQSTSWIDTHLSLPHTVYNRFDPSAVNYLPNKGNEALAYLHFILSHYEHLPDVTVFVHGHRSGHTHSIPERMRTALTRVRLTHSTSATSSAASERIDVTDHVWLLRHLQYGKAAFMPLTVGTYTWIGAQVDSAIQRRDFAPLQHVWPTLFQTELGPIPHAIAYYCCASVSGTNLPTSVLRVA
jgi:hypothetical protein